MIKRKLTQAVGSEIVCPIDCTYPREVSVVACFTCRTSVVQYEVYDQETLSDTILDSDGICT